MMTEYEPLTSATNLCISEQP